MSDQHDKYIAIWSKAVDTQMHFNEMSVKSRQLGLTFVAAALGVALVLLSRAEDFALFIPVAGFTIQVHIAVFLLAAAAIALNAVKGLDLGVYHRMLRGAVTFGEDFERNYMRQVFDLNKGMTETISHYSRHTDADKTLEGTKYVYKGSNAETAEDKIKRFYSGTMWFIALSALLLLILTNVGTWRSPTDPSVEVQQRPIPTIGPAPER